MSQDHRSIYLQKKSLKAAREIVFERFPAAPAATERIAAAEACGRVLAEPVYAAISSPNFHAAAMDGLAVRAARTYGASESSPLQLLVGRDAFPVNTGHMMPGDCDAVIMIEDVNFVDSDEKTRGEPLSGSDSIQIEAPVYPWQNVRKMGEDMVATELVFPRNHRITPYCIGALITAGIKEVSVWAPPTVLIIPTGSELVDHENADPRTLPAGRILESNSHMLGRLVASCGGSFIRHSITADETESIRGVLEETDWGCVDMVLILGGSSAGSEDYTRAVLDEMGEVYIHGVTMMPGKPVIAGKIEETPVFGLPGYPVSSIIAFEQLIQPLLLRMLNQPEPEPESIRAMPTRKLPSKLGVEEFVRVKIGKVGETLVATPLPRGAGSITSITEADGMVRIPDHVEGLAADAQVSVNLLKPLRAVRSNLVCVGSHDNTLDVLADMIRAESREITLSSSHVGSMGGLMAVKRGLCHLAGTHLLDIRDGNYNISYIERYLPEKAVHLIHLVKRDQGLIIRPGNPKGITGVEDLARSDVEFINRQPGSGTRILLDYRLEKMNIAATDISGYEAEEYTHMAVAVAVVSGAADVGLGIYAAARALNLEFIPVVTESYDLVIPDEFMDTPPIRLLFDIVASAEFRSRVAELGGYDVKESGKIIWKSK